MRLPGARVLPTCLGMGQVYAYHLETIPVQYTFVRYNLHIIHSPNKKNCQLCGCLLSIFENFQVGPVFVVLALFPSIVMRNGH